MTHDEEALLTRFLVETGDLDAERGPEGIRDDFQDWYVWLRTKGHTITGERHYKAMLTAARAWERASADRGKAMESAR